MHLGYAGTQGKKKDAINQLMKLTDIIEPALMDLFRKSSMNGENALSSLGKLIYPLKIAKMKQNK
jgi:hypothetical protein